MAARLKALVAEARWRGLWGTVRAVKMNKMGSFKCFVGEDPLGNRYFENRNETYGRDRWVEYCENQNPDSLNVTPEWHAWLHHNTDDTPTDHPLPKPDYQTEVTGNPTGTKNAYVPPHHKLSKHYAGAASEKYETWTPSAKKQIPIPEGKDVFDLK